ncbi:MAG: acyl-CoA dehydrogenase family protein [Dehalococcoidia bacterium]
MNLDFTEDEELIRSISRDFLEKEYPRELVRELEEDPGGYSPQVWQKMAQLGWMGLLLPEEYGGIDGNFMQLVILMEEMGRACMDGPFFYTTLCARAILDAGTEEQRNRFLSSIAEGKMIVSLALTEPIPRFDAEGITTSAEPEGEEFVINGTKLFVQDAQVADYLLCTTLTDPTAEDGKGITLFLVDAQSSGIRITPLDTMAHEHANEVILENVQVPKENMLGEINQGWPIMENLLRQAIVAKCAQMNGGADWVVAESVAYSKERVQYGKPIGAYQVIQHYLADMWTDAGLGKRMTYYAAWKIDQGIPCERETSMLKAFISEAYNHTSRMGIQIHGALGTARDHDMGLYYQRARQAWPLFGDPDFHREKIARLMGI